MSKFLAEGLNAMKTKLMHAITLALLFTLATALSWSQATAGKVQGKITQGGKPVANAQITLTNTANGRTYKMKTDKDGTFSGVGIMFGEYEQEIADASGEKLFKRKVSVSGGQGDVKGNAGAPDDLSADIASGGGAPKISAEEMEKLKAQREKTMSWNALISQYNAAQQSKNWQAAADTLKQMIAAAPNNWEYQQALGDMQLNLGQFDQAAATYEKALPAAENASKDPKADPAKIKAAIGKML